MMDAPVDSPRRKRKRPKVPEERRLRASTACGSCRRLKEKCDGVIPCERCRRFRRDCVPAVIVQTASRHHDNDSDGSERVRNLEIVARHFFGGLQLDDARLERVVQSLDDDATFPGASEDVEAPALAEERFTVKSLPRSTFHYSGEFSHWNFSERVRNQVDERLKRADSSNVQDHFRILDHWRASHLQSQDASVRKVPQHLPRKQVAFFLAEVYFRYAQTNSFFVEAEWTLTKLHDMYSVGVTFIATDAPWLCTLLATLAVATQFAHLAHDSAFENMPFGDTIDESAMDAVGVSLYHMAAELIPIVITVASIESVQAFLMLAHYALPLDTQGLAYSYLGLALTMAVQNGMHRKLSNGNSVDIVADSRNRLWWTVYRLEKRVGILHGRPRSIARIDIDAEYPPDNSPESGQVANERIWENIMTKLTDWLGDLAFAIQLLRRSPQRLRQAYFARLFETRGQYVHWWRELSIPTATSSNSRAIVHLHLSHHLNMVFLGRTFMFSHSDSNKSTDHKRTEVDRHASLTDKQLEMVSDGVASAEAIVALCHSLKLGDGLAKSSYIEFTSCRAAVLVLLAQSLQRSSSDLRSSLAQGVDLIQHMASANESTQSDASVVAAIEAAIRLLDSKTVGAQHHEHSVAVSNTGELAFEDFKLWASGFQQKDAAGTGTSLTDASDVPPSAVYDMFGDLGWTPFDASLFDNEIMNIGSLETTDHDVPADLAYTLSDVPTVPRRG